jgi:DNA primase
MSDFERSLQDIKEEVRARVDIVEIVSRYTSLKKAGKDWSGLCPFHNDKKPSFRVSPQFQSYKCWSCGESGDIFTIVQKKENLDFVEALEWLAKRAGIVFERKKGDPQKASEREQALELNHLAVAFFKEGLTKSQEARDYLVRRKILKSTQEQWELGFAVPGDSFTYALQRKGADVELAVKIGLVKINEQGHYYDGFRNRLMFPIHDLQGRVIAFGGRAMDDNPAKYLNSPASLLFDKSRTLYGLCFARKKLGGDTPPVFVEGYVDVITTHQAGFTQCVATLGTAMTEQHAQMLKNYNPRVILCYDSDRAGIGAALKGAAIWESMGIENAEVRVARLPDGDDPDSLLNDRENGSALFQTALDTAIPRVDFQIELSLKRHDLHTEQGRADALAEFIPILAAIRESTRRDRYAQKFAYLSPLHNYDLGRAISSLLADAEMYARQSQEARSPRDQGYPLTHSANGESLQEQPPPPMYRGPTQKQWGGGRPQWPNTREVIRKGEGGNTSGGNSYGYGYGGGYGNKGNYGGGWSRGRKDGPVGDPTPPPLDMPANTGAEKAERQILRALFSPDWRVYILNNMQPTLLVTPYGRRLYEIIARTPANLEGGIDPLPILHRAQNEEEAAEAPAPSALKFSYFIQEVLEDSTFIASNERLNEAAIANCIARLKKHRDEQEVRVKSAALYDMELLPPEQQRDAMNQYLEKMRALRGSPPKEESG